MLIFSGYFLTLSYLALYFLISRQIINIVEKIKILQTKSWKFSLKNQYLLFLKNFIPSLIQEQTKIPDFAPKYFTFLNLRNVKKYMYIFSTYNLCAEPISNL